MSGGAGKDLNDLLQEVQEAAKSKAQEKGSDDGFAPLNVEVPKSLLKDIRLISAFEEVTIKALVADLLADAVASKKRLVIKAMIDAND